MELSQFFPVWNQLSPSDRELLERSAIRQTVKKGTLLHNGEEECLGLLVILSGQLRAFILSEEGREVTLYRLFEYDICLFSASCVMQNISFAVSIEAEKDCELFIIPAYIYKKIMDQSLPFSNYSNQLMASRFSDVMWVMQQILFMSMDKRLAIFLTDEAARIGSDTINLTHEQIAKYMGSAREVVSRMLKYFTSEGIVESSRKGVKILDKKRLRHLAM